MNELELDWRSAARSEPEITDGGRFRFAGARQSEALGGRYNRRARRTIRQQTAVRHQASCAGMLARLMILMVAMKRRTD
jgi:hypothetical protein